MKLLKNVIKTIFISGVAALLSYLSSSSFVFDKLQKLNVLSPNIDIPLMQDWCLWIGIAISSLFLSLNLIITQHKYERALEERNCLVAMAKSILASSFVKRYFSKEVTFDIRIFVPKRPLWYAILDLLHIKTFRKKFVIKNISLIADQGITKGLQFEVYPEIEGLVGQCYVQKKVLYDDDLKTTNERDYNLGKQQISRTNNLSWIICCPVFGNNDEVVAILALDGKAKISISKNNEGTLGAELSAFSRMLFDAVPKLFKR